MSVPNDKRALHWIARDGQSVRIGDWYLAQIDTAILRGEMFRCFAEITLNAGQTKICQLKTGNINTYAYGLRVSSNIEKFRFAVFEAPTITDGVTELSPVNMDRTSANTPLYKLFTDPTNVSGGTKIIEYVHYSLPNAPSQTDIEQGEFYFLKRNTSYSLQFTNGDNGTRQMFGQFLIQENKDQ
jgi:hypothetical protein